MSVRCFVNGDYFDTLRHGDEVLRFVADRAAGRRVEVRHGGTYGATATVHVIG